MLMLQLVFSFFVWKYLPGLSVYFWLLTGVPVLVWMVVVCKDTESTRCFLYYSYLACLLLSCIWGCVGPWIIKANFWGNHCLDFLPSAKTGEVTETDKCSTWHFTMLFVTLLRVPF